jgi:dephospho-CoA kinase
MRQSKGGIKVIGLTGNTGSGKGSAAAILARAGGFVIDTDALAHAVIEPEGAAYDEVLEFFGQDILNGSDKHIDRKKLGNIVFNDRDKLVRLMDITYKHINNEVTRLLAGCPQDTGFAVVDAPMLLESDIREICDEIWLVWAHDYIRLERVLARDGITAEAAKLRMANQPRTHEMLASAEAFAEGAGVPLNVIENNGSLAQLEEYVCGCLRG